MQRQSGREREGGRGGEHGEGYTNIKVDNDAELLGEQVFSWVR